MILRSDVQFRDNAAGVNPTNCSKVKRCLEDYTPIHISLLTLDSVHTGRILIGKIVTPPLIMKSIMTFIEDDGGSIMKIAVYNAIANLKARRLIAAADSLLKEGSWIGIIDPFYKRFMDGTEGVRVDDPTKLISNLKAPFRTTGAKINVCPASTNTHEPANSAHEVDISTIVGSIVTLRGLKTRPELNGKRAVVEANLGGERVRVSGVFGALSGDTSSLSVRMENITIEPQPGEGVASSAPSVLARPMQSSAEQSRIEEIKARGNALLQRGVYAKAEEAYLQALSAVEELHGTGQETIPGACRGDLNEAAGAASRGTSRDDSASQTFEQDMLVALHCNLSLVHLRQGEAAAALADACRALRTAPGLRKARLRRAEAALALGLAEQAADDLTMDAADRSGRGAQDGASAGDEALRARIDSLAAAATKLPTVRATPADLASHLRAARPGTTIQLAPGLYLGPFRVDTEVRLVGPGGGDEQAVMDATESRAPTLDICVSGRVVLSGLTVRRSPVPGDDSLCSPALIVRCGSVAAHGCFFCSAAGPCFGAERLARAFLWACTIADGAAGGLLSAGAKVHALEVTVRGNSASGVEVREGGELVLERSRVWGNGKQGVVVWCQAARADLLDCEVFEHRSSRRDRRRKCFPSLFRRRAPFPLFLLSRIFPSDSLVSIVVL